MNQTKITATKGGFLIQGKERRRKNFLVRTLEYQQRKWGHCEVREARINDLKKGLEEKVK